MAVLSLVESGEAASERLEGTEEIKFEGRFELFSIIGGSELRGMESLWRRHYDGFPK